MILTPRRPTHFAAIAIPFACLLLAGCRVSTNRNGKNDNVEIGTPFGDMHVKTNDAANISALGLTIYPGAVPSKEHDGKDSDNADVNMNFGSFHLGVQAASFQTSDQPDKVLAFYRKDLARYGDVIECRDNAPIGQPTHTSQGLTCDENGHHHNYTSDSGLELRAGSDQRQHIVAVDANDGGAKITLVALDLPSRLGEHNSKDVE